MASSNRNHRTGAETTWTATAHPVTPAERARLHEEAARRTVERVERLSAPMEPTPYLSAKGVGVHKGVYAQGRTTVIPAMDANGKVWTAQSIFPDGAKRFAKGGRKTGCFHAVGGVEAVEKAPCVVIAEGYATAASLAEALDCGTVAAFDAGNLVPVARALQERFPDKKVIVAGDDDRETEKTRGVNPGREKAAAAAEAVGGMTVFPTFAPGDPELTDFNDLANSQGLGEVKQQIFAELKRQMVAERTQERAQGQYWSHGLSL